MHRLLQATRFLRWTGWFALIGVIVAAANLLIGNHITFAFWVAGWALPGLLLDLSRMLNGSQAWKRQEGWITWRTVGWAVILVGVASPLESVIDPLGGYHPTNALVNTDWSQLSDVVAVSVAFPAARQFMQWTRPLGRSHPAGERGGGQASGGGEGEGHAEAEGQRPS